jgi:hypothetical protein
MVPLPSQASRQRWQVILCARRADSLPYADLRRMEIVVLPRRAGDVCSTSLAAAHVPGAR